MNCNNNNNNNNTNNNNNEIELTMDLGGSEWRLWQMNSTWRHLFTSTVA